MAKFCGNCGKPLGENNKVCGNCGTPVAVNETVSPTAQSRAMSNATNGKRAAVIGVALLAVIVLSIALIKAASEATPKPSTSPTSSALSSSTAQQIAANSSAADVEPTPIQAEKKETIEERAKKAIKELEVWDGSIAESFDGGDGSAENPYQIANGAQLAKLASDTNSGIDFSDKHFMLTSDIMLNDIRMWDFEKSPESNIQSGILSGQEYNRWNGIGYPHSGNQFGGIFDGGEHTVWGMVAKENTSWQGLFGATQGEIRNLYVICAYLASVDTLGGRVGTIVASLNGGSISNCHTLHTFIDQEMRLNGIGGVCGSIRVKEVVNISNCSADTVTIHCRDASSLGGVIGTLNLFGELYIDNCYSNCDIEVTGNIVDTRIGGICPYADAITNCYSDSYISLDSDTPISGAVGGIVGSCFHRITNCGSSGNIQIRGDSSGSENSHEQLWIGGLAACHVSNEIEFHHCFYSGIIECDSSKVVKGGLLGESFAQSITNCVYNSTNNLEMVGFMPDDITLFTDQVIALSSENEFKDSINYVNWDFDTTWILDRNTNNGLPILRSLVDYLD